MSWAVEERVGACLIGNGLRQCGYLAATKLPDLGGGANNIVKLPTREITVV